MKKHVKPISVCGICFILLFTTLPIVGGDSEYYHNSFVMVFGQCEWVNCPILWRLGLYIPILKKNMFIRTTNQPGEIINIIVKNEETALLYNQANATLQLNRVRGIFFWGGNSLLLQNTSLILLVGRAEDICITH